MQSTHAKRAFIAGAVTMLGFIAGNAVAQDVGARPAAVPPASNTPADWVVLFDGTSLDNFRGYRKGEMPDAGWELVDGTLHHKAGGGGGDLVTRGRYGDFELEFDWKVAEGANSGVFYRVSEEESAPYLTGSEYQVLDNTKHVDGKNPKTSAGAIYALYAAEKDVTRPVGEWNTAKIVVIGNVIEHWLNGELIVKAEIGSDDWNARVAESKFKDWKKYGTKTQGHLVFQDHGDDVWYRNIRVKSAKAAEQAPKEQKPAVPAPASS